MSVYERHNVGSDHNGKAERGGYSVTISDGDHGEVHYSPTVSDACRVINSYLTYHTLADAIRHTSS